MTRTLCKLVIPGYGTYMLVDHEIAIFRYAALGYTNDEIAPLLGITNRTVESWRTHMMSKLQITTRRELVQLAIAAGVFREE